MQSKFTTGFKLKIVGVGTLLQFHLGFDPEVKLHKSATEPCEQRWEQMFPVKRLIL